MRKRYIQDPKTGKLVPAELYTPERVAAHVVMPDKAGYVSPLDGSYVDGRAAHRAHMRKHGVIEVGNEPLRNPATRAVDERKHRESLRRDIAKTLSGYGI